MSLLGNIIWLIFGGFLAGMGYILGGLLLCLTIVGIPFGLQAIKLGTATMTPFGRQIVEDNNANGVVNIVLNVVWMLVVGWGIAITHLTHALILAITIIGLPFAKQHVKLVVIALFPFGRRFQRLS
ncbi:MAG: YccF domain-containing protein [Leptolyngbya sp.]|nr:YccF domain-containing protein [Leptolyngbya sp.]